MNWKVISMGKHLKSVTVAYRISEKEKRNEKIHWNLNMNKSYTCTLFGRLMVINCLTCNLKVCGHFFNTLKARHLVKEEE